ncbi:unnamed protein product [Staurois parvus]|uniref:Uncharacterized protein n=1 Tax=Staurois parvus TaxID=386267 RepID=A0ABN9CM82_9NEOB|nr:unnamed protein product [Staurois parvus]
MTKYSASVQRLPLQWCSVIRCPQSVSLHHSTHFLRAYLGHSEPGAD